MNRKYESENEVLIVVKSFEDGSISRNDWKHMEHLTVAMYYLSHHEIETATEKMRSGIFNLLVSFGVDITKEMPYHETLTVFWMETLKDFARSGNGTSLLEKVNAAVDVFDKDYPLRYYSRDYLFSDKAKSHYVAGDL